MKRNGFALPVTLISLFILALSCYHGGPDIVTEKSLKGYVIGKENCSTIDPTSDYWLIDFTYGSNNPKVGDTLILNGTTYSNVLKTKNLAENFKIAGLKLSVGYTNISNKAVVTTNCTVSSSITYLLKEVTIDYQAEIQ